MLVEIQEEYFDGFYYHIPSSYNGYDVVAIGEGALGDGRIRILDIPASVRHIEERAFADATALVSITVDENNTAFKSMDDVLYSADGKNLVFGKMPL